MRLKTKSKISKPKHRLIWNIKFLYYIFMLYTSTCFIYMYYSSVIEKKRIIISCRNCYLCLLFYRSKRSWCLLSFVGRCMYICILYRLCVSLHLWISHRCIKNRCLATTIRRSQRHITYVQNKTKLLTVCRVCLGGVPRIIVDVSDVPEIP